MHWVAGIGAAASVVTAASVVVGAYWAYFHYIREAPFVTRADVVVSACLFRRDLTQDLLEVTCTLRALGKGRVYLVEGKSPLLALYAFTTDMLETGEPGEWGDLILKAQEVFTAETELGSGETVSEVHLLPVTPNSERLAYRVELTIWAVDPTVGEYEWRGMTYVSTAGAQPKPLGQDGNQDGF